jgi:hypothetical protein
MGGTLNAPDAGCIRQALKIAAKLDWPVAARSLTEAEMAASERRQWGCCVWPIAVVALAAPLAMAFDPTQRLDDAMMMAAIGLGLVGLLWLATRWRFRRPSDYVDPGIVIEVATDGVTIAADGRLHRLDFAEAAARFGYVLTGRGGTFRGLVLDLPGRPIAIGGDMLDGYRAAAAIVAGCVAAGIWADPR